jgi:hypothetical protein
VLEVDAAGLAGETSVQLAAQTDHDRRPEPVETEGSLQAERLTERRDIFQIEVPPWCCVRRTLRA